MISRERNQPPPFSIIPNNSNSNHQTNLNHKITTASSTPNANHTAGNHRLHHHYNTPNHRSSPASFKGCCCCLFLLFSFIALLIISLILIILLAVKPKKPTFDLRSVTVQYVGITPSPAAVDAVTTASVSLNIRLLFTAANDNKVGIKYGESRFSVMYRGIPLGRGSVPSFYQAAHSLRQVAVNIAVDKVNLLQTDAANLIRDASLNDRVEFRIFGDVGAKIRIIGITSPGVQVSVDCQIAISPSKQALTYKQCGVDGLSV